MQDIEIGDPYFDDNFVIKGNSEERVKLLLRDTKLKQLIDVQSDICFEIKDDEGWFGSRFPEGVDELYFSCPSVLRILRI